MVGTTRILSSWFLPFGFSGQLFGSIDELEAPLAISYQIIQDILHDRGIFAIQHLNHGVQGDRLTVVNIEFKSSLFDCLCQLDFTGQRFPFVGSPGTESQTAIEKLDGRYIAIIDDNIPFLFFVFCAKHFKYLHLLLVVYK